MAKRLTRAKHKIEVARVPYRVPEDHELPARLPPVLAVVYLIYNAGLDGRGASGLCGEAIRLARLLTALMPDEAEVTGLLALLLLIEARGATRTAPDGTPIVLWPTRIDRAGIGR
jgi:RNA polymerase sigma-70 factor (ECF subfamily)